MPSRLSRALGVTRLEVNSFHHQAIRELGRGLVITARAEDGLIEAVESPPEAPWLLAVQWHPEEFHAEADAPDHGLFEEFVREAERVRG
jgi:putative glutamine amidotransferase